MARDGRPNYLKAAFLNVYNLSLLGGAAFASVATGEYLLGAVALGAEALWLLFGPDLRPFKRAVDSNEREERDAADRERVKKLMEQLPEREWARAHALDELRREIERDMQVNPSFQAILLQSELDKLSQLHMSFVSLAAACVRAETYLAATDLKDLQKQVTVQQGIEKTMEDPAVKEIARKNALVLQRRLDTIREIQNFLARARGQMNLIENSVRLLRDQVLTMASPDQLGDQLDDLLTGVEAIQASAKDNEAILSRIDLEPIAPIEAADAVSQRGGRVRELMAQPRVAIALREVEEGDLPTFFEFQSDPVSNQLAAFVPREWDNFLLHWRSKILGDGRTGKKTIVLGGEVVGNICSWNDEGRRMLGYWVGRAHWGRGVASAALTQYLKVETVRPLFALVASHNVGSARVLEKCGFAQVGDTSTSHDGVEERLFRLEV